MKISKQLNKFCFALFVSSFFIQITFASEKVENIWKVIENKKISNKEQLEKKNK